MRATVLALISLFLIGSVEAQTTTISNSKIANVTINVVPGGGGGGGTLPATLGWYEIPNTSIASLCPSYAEIQGTSGCAAVVTAWGNAEMDASRNWLIIQGGGHGDYFGNELFAIDFTTNPISRFLLKDATHNPNLGAISCNESFLDGSWGVRHGFAGEEYFPILDKYFLFGGGKPGCGFLSNFQWTFDPTKLSAPWTQITPPGTSPNPAGSGGVNIGAYNPVDDLYYYVDPNTGEFWQYNYRTNVWVDEVNIGSKCSGTNINATIDVAQQFFVCAGQNVLAKVKIGSPWTSTALQGSQTGCTTAISAGGPGLEYDPIQQKEVLWVGGNSVYVYSLTSNSCTTVTFTGGPTVAVNGALKKWRYNPAVGGFVTYNDITKNAWFLRLSSLGTAAATDFSTRCAASGVIVCRNLSTSADIVHNTYAFAATDGTTFPVLDTSTYTSGGASVMFTIPAVGGANPAGSVSYPFSTSGTGVGQVQFGANTTFYVQFRQKFSAAYITNQWKTGDGSETSWKQIDFHWGDFPSKTFSSCGWIEWTTGNYANLGFPIIYGHCGATDLYQPVNGSDFLLEQGQSSTASGSQVNNGYNLGYNCFYSTRNTTRTTCMTYQPGIWYTFYYQVNIGTYGSSNSSIKGYVTWNGMPYRQFVNFSGLPIDQDSPTINAFNYLSIFPYMTGRSTSFPVAAISYTWYNEIIVSSNPIAAPTTPAAQN